MNHILSLGMIPSDCSSDRIACGDPDSHGGFEYTLIFSDESKEISCLETDGMIEVDTEIPEELDAATWDRVMTSLLDSMPTSGDSSVGAPTAEIMHSTWMHFLGELEEDLPALRPIDSECGEFSNSDGLHNGTWYCRYQLEDEDDYLAEEVAIIDLSVTS